jgi:hypothetical protein
MKGHLFHPPTRSLPSRLLLVPFFVDRSSFSGLQKKARRRSKLLHADLLEFDDFAVIANFMGYPFLLTLLEHVEGIGGKEIFFLGTAGSIGTGAMKPQTLHVVSVTGSGFLRRFTRKGRLELEHSSLSSFKSARAVSVDIPQRENRSWVRGETGKRTTVVEMELFPLRVFLGKPFVALVVTTDRVSASGIRPFADREAVRAEFRRALGFVMEWIVNGNSHPQQAL